MKKPQNINESVYYKKYIDVASGVDLSQSLKLSNLEFEQTLNEITEEQSNYKYAEGKWTIKQVVQHIIDVERLFVARALSIARDKTTIITEFDEDVYAANDFSSKLTFKYILNDYKLVRQSTISFFKSLNDKNIDNEVKGKFLLSPRIIGWLISGHTTHHISVIKNKYL